MWCHEGFFFFFWVEMWSHEVKGEDKILHFPGMVVLKGYYIHLEARECTAPFYRILQVLITKFPTFTLNYSTKWIFLGQILRAHSPYMNLSWDFMHASTVLWLMNPLKMFFMWHLDCAVNGLALQESGPGPIRMPGPDWLRAWQGPLNMDLTLSCEAFRGIGSSQNLNFFGICKFL